MGCSSINSIPNPLVTVISNSSIFPSEKSAMADLKLSVSDLPMLSCHYIQKGALFDLPRTDVDLESYLRSGLSRALSLFPPLAGRFLTDAATGEIFISCNDAGAGLTLSSAASVTVHDLLASPGDVPPLFKQLFSLDGEVSYAGHVLPLLAVQATILADGVFIGCSVNHAVVDGTSFWNFFNAFSDLCRGLKIRPSTQPEFDRSDSVLVSSTAVLKIPPGGPAVTFSADEPLRERIFTFSRTSLLRLKSKANNNITNSNSSSNSNNNDVVELISKISNDRNGGGAVVSSFQSMCALVWRCVTRARGLSDSKTTTFRMAVNCRHRLRPSLDPLYFGNAIQSIPTTTAAGELLAQDLPWCGELLRRNVAAYDDGTIRRNVAAWEADPKCFPLGNFDGAMITMGSSPRFPMYGADFGSGKPLAVRSGRANKFDGKMSAFPGRSGDGCVDVEVVLCPQTMAALESDPEFLEFASCD